MGEWDARTSWVRLLVVLTAWAEEAEEADRNGESFSTTASAEAGRSLGDFSRSEKSSDSTPRGTPWRRSSSSSGGGLWHCILRSSRGDAERKGGWPASIS